MSGAHHHPLSAAALQDGLELTPCEAAVLAVLWRKRAGWIDADTLNRLTADASPLYDHAAELRGRLNVQVHICNLRKRFGHDVVLTYWGRGYTLGALGVLACKRVLAVAA